MSKPAISPERATAARKLMMRRLAGLYKQIIEARTHLVDHGHDIEGLQVRVCGITNALVNFQEVSRAFQPPPENKKTDDPWVGRTHISYKGPNGWEPATVRDYNPETGKVKIRLERGGQTKTTSIHSGLVR